jgi:hypothetical protein
MLRARYSLFVVLALFLATSHAQEANPPGTSPKKENKIPGISTVIVVTGSKTDEAQQNVTQRIPV